MLREIFAVVYILLVAVLVASIVKAAESKSKMAKPVIKVIFAGAMTALFYALYLIVAGMGRQPACFLLGMYYLSVGWMSYWLTDYAMEYTEVRLVTRQPRVILLVLVVLDSISILVNNFTGHVFSMIQLYDESIEAYYWTSQPQGYMNAHLALCYVMVALTFIALIYKTIVSPRFYRKKYAVIVILLAIVIVVNAGFLFVGLEIDFSVLFYAILGPFVRYFTLHFTPSNLAMMTQSYVIEEIGNGIICFDIDGSCVYVNRAAKKLFTAWNDEEDIDRIEKQYAQWREKNHGKDSDYWEDEIPIAGTQHFFGFEYCNMRDENGASIGSFFRIEDKTEDVKRLKDEQYRATHDRLTGLYNREGFFEEAEKFIKEHADESMYMLASNIKDFKLVNELFGDEKGDEVLEKEARLLKDKGAKVSVLGRIAGDRFVQIVLKKDFDDSYLLENIRTLCSLTEDRIYKMHVYAGVYEIKDVNESVQTMYDKANMAIERIKGDYNQVISYYDESDMNRLMHEKSIVAEFDKALENEEFCMYLQPQLDSRGTLLGAEALVRWNHPKRGLLYPDSFVGILEKTGIIYKLDNFIWEKAAGKVKEWNEAGYKNYHISVNISAKDFYYLDLYKVFTGIVRKYGISPKSLNLEITETVIMSDVKMHMDIMDKLQKFGFQIEIDDFGSGYSSLNTLKDIKADLLKIDMMFLRETDNQERSGKILKSIITMAKALNMDVITEGVETEKQLDFLFGIGCGMFQGFYFSKPIPVDEFEDKYFQS